MNNILRSAASRHPCLALVVTWLYGRCSAVYGLASAWLLWSPSLRLTAAQCAQRLGCSSASPPVQCAVGLRPVVTAPPNTLPKRFQLPQRLPPTVTGDPNIPR